MSFHSILVPSKHNCEQVSDLGGKVWSWSLLATKQSPCKYDFLDRFQEKYEFEYMLYITSNLFNQRSTYTSRLREFRVIDMFRVGFAFCWSVICWMNMHLTKEQEIAFWLFRRCLCQHHPYQQFCWLVEKYSFSLTVCFRGEGIEGWWGVGGITTGSCFCSWAELQGCCISLHLLCVDFSFSIFALFGWTLLFSYSFG